MEYDQQTGQNVKSEVKAANSSDIFFIGIVTEIKDLKPVREGEPFSSGTPIFEVLKNIFGTKDGAIYIGSNSGYGCAGNGPAPKEIYLYRKSPDGIHLTLLRRPDWITPAAPLIKEKYGFDLAAYSYKAQTFSDLGKNYWLSLMACAAVIGFLVPVIRRRLKA